jgi:SAM-dependent methyltransferase
MTTFSPLRMPPDAGAAEPLPRRQFQLSCPVCFRHAGAIDALDASATATCSACRFTFSNREGIWRALAPDRKDRFRQFSEEYRTVRALEGRGSSDPDFYLRLPYEDSMGRNCWQWRIRGRSFRFFESRILPQAEYGQGRGLDVLDLGAGNCWMSYRLALRGHKLVSVDLIDNVADGLGAAWHYLAHLPNPFVRFQAEMDRLPFQDRQFDLAIFNASFHYSEDYHRTLSEVLRCLRRPGYLAILDSPFYRREQSGRQMVEERKAAFAQRFGFASDSVPSREFITGATLEDLGRTFQLSWNITKPWYGAGWALRPLRARLRRRREPTKFFIVWATVNSALGAFYRRDARRSRRLRDRGRQP